MNRDFDPLSNDLEDFWHRAEAAQTFSRAFELNGCRIRLSANRETALSAVDHALAQYSRAALLHPDREFRIQLVFDLHRSPPGPVPHDLLQLAGFQALGGDFHIDYGPWGHCAADLNNGLATAVFPAALADHPETIARGLLNTLLTNYFFRNGFAMLHATGLVQQNKALLLVAPHNTGKSTTALRLALSGDFALLTDSMVLIAQTPFGLQLTGFPVGRGKLRKDMLPEFPELAGLLTPEQVRAETKFILDLRALDPAYVAADAVLPDEVVLCLLARSGRAETRSTTLTDPDSREAVLRNSLHFDEGAVWQANVSGLERLLQISRSYRLELGTDPAGIRKAVSDLMRAGQP